MAKRLGKIIISEAFLPDQLTIKPFSTLGGHAGGKKYLYNGILFKLQTDWMSIYGGDFYAMKTGGLELKALMRYYGCKGLHVPLMAVIDYRGFRLVAESFLPINKNTLAHGSSDGGRTIVDTNDELRERMKEAAKQLNIKGHLCGRDPNSRKFIYGPTDIEAHVGLDKKFYVIDFARVFPPTAEEDVKKTFLYKVFRPEFVKKYPIPLLSDAFSPFLKGDPKEHEYNMEVKEATNYLFETTIPNFARWLQEYYPSLEIEQNPGVLTELIHREGINCRYLGMVRQHVSKSMIQLRNFLLMEMIARTIKNQLREQMRNLVRNKFDPVDDPFSTLVLEHFNKVLQWHNDSGVFWTQMKQELEKYFKYSLDLTEKKTDFHLENCVDYYFLFRRIQHLTGIRLTRQVQNELKTNPRSVKLVIPDIKKVSVTVKRMNIISLAEGTALAIQAMDAMDEMSESSSHHDRLFRLAMSKFEQAIRSTPDNTSMLCQYAQVLTSLALRKARAGEECFIYFDKAFQKYNLARDLSGLIELGNSIQSLRDSDSIWREATKLFNLAMKCYEEVIKSNDQCGQAYTAYGDLLVFLARKQNDIKTYHRAGKYYRQAVLCASNSVPNLQWIASWHTQLSDLDLVLAIEALKDQKSTNVNVFDANKLFKKELLTNKCIIESAKNMRSSLKTFVLSNCPIGDDSLQAIAKFCSKATTIILSGCTKITDTGIGHLVNQNITFLDISGCSNLSSLSLKYIAAKCSKLNYLNIANCNFQPDFINFFSHLSFKNLKHLDISGHRFQHEAFCRAFALQDLSALHVLIMRSCRDINDSCLTLIAKTAHNLRHLCVSQCSELTDDGLYFIAQNCNELTHLDISHCEKLTSRTLGFFGTFQTSLEETIFDGCPRLYQDKKNFHFFMQNHIKLKKISLKNIPIDNEALSSICNNCPSLIEIDLEATSPSSLGLELLGQRNIRLSKVNLTTCSVTDTVLMQLVKTSASTLTELYCTGCYHITDYGASVISVCSKLTHLSLAQCFKLNKDSIVKICSGCRKLKWLNLSECKYLTDETIEVIADHLHSLEYLNISKCVLITTVAPLVQGCPRLSELILQKCDYISDEAIIALGNCQNLRILDIVGCRLVTDAVFIHLECCPFLEEIRIGMNKMPKGELTTLTELTKTKPHLRVITGAAAQTMPILSTSNELLFPRNSTSSNVTNSNQTSLSQTTQDNVRSKCAIRALMRDLKEIEKNPLPLVSALPVEDNMFIWHCNLKGPEGTPYAGAIFHIQLTFPPSYPSTPPSATIFTPLPHPHVHQDKICLDILSDFQNYFENDRIKGSIGWSAAYTVQTILVQLQAFLMEYKEGESDKPLSKYLSKIPEAISVAQQFQCRMCPHHFNNPWPPLISETKPPAVVTEVDIIREELKCFYSRVSFTEDILGIGINIKRNKKTGAIEEMMSPLDLLSYTAFKEGVRETVYGEHRGKQSFTHWLPLWINKEHGEKAKPLIMQAISEIATDKPNLFEPLLVFQVLPKLMNTMIVMVMQGRLIVSLKALEGYLAFVRLLIMFVKEYPELLHRANKIVRDFIECEDNRSD